MSEFNASGSKYLRPALCTVEGKIDVYAVLDAFAVTCPARQHAIKKLLCSGIRGKGDVRQDLKEARDAVDRAIQMEDSRNVPPSPGDITDAERERIVRCLDRNVSVEVETGIEKAVAGMSEPKTLEQINAWHDAYVDQLVKRGLNRKFAEETLDAGMGNFDYDDNPVDAANEDRSYWSE